MSCCGETSSISEESITTEDSSISTDCKSEGAIVICDSLNITIDWSIEVEDVKVSGVVWETKSIEFESGVEKAITDESISSDESNLSISELNSSISSWVCKEIALSVVDTLKVDSSGSGKKCSNEFHLNLNQSGKIMVTLLTMSLPYICW